MAIERSSEGQEWLKEKRKRLKETLLKKAEPQEVRNFLRKRAENIIEGPFDKGVLIGNLLEEGRVGPLNSGDRSVVRAIETADGWRRVTDEQWIKAFDSFAAELGCNLESAEAITLTSNPKEGGKRKLRNEIRLETNKEGIFIRRIEEFDSESGEPTLISFGIWKQRG